MNAQSMVFDVGDRVTGWGRLIADADGMWLDLARVVTLQLSDRPRRRSRRSVRLIGADIAAAPADFGAVPADSGAAPADHAAAPADLTAAPTDHAAGPADLGAARALSGTATITGVWLGDSIQVERQTPAGPPARAVAEWTTPPCPPPAGGWPRGELDQNLAFDLGDLETSGAAVAVVVFRPEPRQAVLVVAASDVAAVETALRPQLADRLCVVPSRWTRAQLDDVRAAFDGHWDDWALDIVGERIDEHGQPTIEVELLRVTAALANWAETLPEGLLRLVPSLTPLHSG